MDNESKPILLSDIFPKLKFFLKSKKIFLFLILFFLISFLLIYIYLISENKKSKDNILLARESMLNEKIIKLENHNDILEAEILLLQNEIHSLSKQNNQRKLAKISKYLANTEVTGEGVEIILKDAINSQFFDKEKSIIHNTDLLKIVNFLWAQGAIAISINNERLAQNSAITCVGPTILINKKRINSPFKIVAIGKKLNEETIKTSSIMLLLNYRGIGVSINNKSKLTVPQCKYSNK